MIFDNHLVIVPDTSFYQDDNGTPQGINFIKMKEAGAEGVILRGGQNTWKDEDFLTNVKAAKEAGLPRGYYWFFDSRSNPVRQAELWDSLIMNDLPELGLWYDFEESYNGPYRGERYWKQFSLTMDALYPTTLRGIYTAKWWWDRQVVEDPFFWSECPLWVAQYGVPAEDVVLPFPWRNKEALFWQFTAHGNGTHYGVESLNIDLNYFNGSKTKFYNTFKIQSSEPTEPTEPGEPMADYVELKPNVAGEYRSIRAQTTYPRPPHIVGVKIGQIDSNSSGKAIATDFYKYTEDVIISGETLARTGDIWWKVYEANGRTVSGWAAEIHLGRRYLNPTLVPENPTPTPTRPTLNIEISDDEGNYPTLNIEWKPK